MTIHNWISGAELDFFHSPSPLTQFRVDTLSVVNNSKLDFSCTRKTTSATANQRRRSFQGGRPHKWPCWVLSRNRKDIAQRSPRSLLRDVVPVTTDFNQWIKLLKRYSPLIGSLQAQNALSKKAFRKAAETSIRVLSRCVRSLFGPSRISFPWGNFSDGGLNQSIKRRLLL